MDKICKNPWCNQPFEVTPEDLAFYDKVSPVFVGKKEMIPPPSLCPGCRQQKRLAWRNERSLFKRSCSLTAKPFVSLYSPDTPYTVYAQDVWWSDAWDPLTYGREIDFSRPFFEQFAELLKTVPHMGMFIAQGHNSDYCPYSTEYKDSYMCVSGRKGENIYYSFMLNDSQDCMDCYACSQCELCYECIQCVQAYNTMYSVQCKNSNDLAFCMGCEGCQNCIGCYGLRQQKYHVFNKPVSKEEYEALLATLHSSSTALRDFQEQARSFFAEFPRKAVQMINSENCSGDYLLNCSNARFCYLSEDLEDCAYVWNTPSAKDCMDMNYSSKTELIYNAMSNVNSYGCVGCAGSWDMKQSFYCFQSFNSTSLFGCAGLRQKRYCILNREYTQEQYEELVPKIIALMREHGEWGEFFPSTLSPFAYNETIAQEFFPLTEEETSSRQLLWRDKGESNAGTTRVIPAHQLPERIQDIPDDVLNWGIECQETAALYRLIAKELQFYRERNLPVPRVHPDVRHKRRLQFMNPRKLWNRECSKCQKPISTSYAPERPETVFCEECFLAAVY